jgi:cytochrome P450
MPAFAFRHIKDLYPTFWSKSCEMVKAIQGAIQAEATEDYSDKKEAPVVEIGQWTSRATLDIIGVAGMGQDFNAIEDPDTELCATYRSIFQPNRQARLLGLLSLFIPMWLIRMLPVKRNAQIRDAAASIRKVCRQLIGQKKAKMNEKEKRVDTDIISVALESGGFTEDNLVDQMMTFLAAGHETTASAMVWAIYLLCQNPEIQAHLREEVRRGLPSIENTKTPVTSDVLDKLPFLHAVCNEVLRVYPPVALTLREAVHDTSIRGQFVPAGAKIVLVPWALNSSTELWGPDASKFIPDRWMGPGRANNGGAESAYSFMTFLHGPRSCIGQAFAKAEFACLLASLVGRFEMELADKEYTLEIQGGITARPKGGLRIRMREIEGW